MSEVMTVQEAGIVVQDEMQHQQQAAHEEGARRPQRITSSARLFDSVSLPMMQYLQQPAGGH